VQPNRELVSISSGKLLRSDLVAKVDDLMMVDRATLVSGIMNDFDH